MTYGWSARDRLTPMRMVWLGGSHYYKFELRKWQRRSLRQWQPDLRARTKVDDDRESRQRYPGATGRWPLNVKRRKKSRVSMQVDKAGRL